MSEAVVLDPSEVTSDRVELDITRFIAEPGPDFGDAALEQYLAEAQLGQQPVDSRVPNRQIVIPLNLTEWGDTIFEEIRGEVQAKASLFQREGGWIKRELPDGPVYADVIGATLKFGGSSLQAWGLADTDAVLTLDAIPEWYGDEIELAVHSETSAAEISFAEPTIIGNHPGRVRIVVSEDGAKDRLGLIWSFRSRHYSDAATAASAYEAEDLEPLDTAAVAALSGASGGDVVRHTNLSTNWTPVLGTNIGGSDYLTHTGTYRLWARVYSTSGDAVQVRAVWDVGDLTLPVENTPAAIPGATNFYMLDLGEVRLDPPPVGIHRWRAQLQAKGLVGGEQVQIDELLILNVDDGYGVLRAPVRASVGLGDYSARDEFNQSAGALTGRAAPVGGSWAGAGDSDDFAVETTGRSAQRTAVSDVSTDTGRFVTVGPTLAATLVGADLKRGTYTAASNTLYHGVLARYIDTSNWLGAFLTSAGASDLKLRVIKCVAGATSELKAVANPYDEISAYASIVLLADEQGRYFCWVTPQGQATGEPLIVGIDSALATGGALDDGKAGIYDAKTGTAAVTRNVKNFWVAEPSTDAVLFASRTLELRYDRMIRKDAAGAAFGPVSHVEGDLCRVPPSGLEGRPVEVVLKLSRGDLSSLPDSGIDDTSAHMLYRPSWLFVPETEAS